MSKIGQLIEFNKEEFFDGAVQSDWFYDIEKRRKVAESYIFHGPKYFGVGETDIKNTKHKLIDSISFINSISQKISYDSDSSRFVLTIAGYGAGKSHLSVAMGAIFSGDDTELQKRILSKIESSEPELANDIKSSTIKPNLVIVLNGMKDFNLNYEVLRCTREALKLHDVSDDFLKEMTQAYSTAVTFVENTYDAFKSDFIEFAKGNKKYGRVLEENLKQALLDNMESDIEAFNIVNEAYNKVTGSYIRWDNGLTAAQILAKINTVLCEEKRIFNKIIVLFDEFGRYIEYTAAYPQQAGESALQQIFEAVQNANKNIVFIGFIQSDLNAYLSRVQNTNIVRYLGRYEASDKYYLSSNLETILSNLLRKKSPEQYDEIVETVVIEKNNFYNNRLFNNIHRWLKDASNRGVWKDRKLYNNVILKGAYPIHPLTTWIMSNLSTWMQQRSTLTFVEDIFEDIKNEEMVDESLFYVYPTKIIESKLFDELLNAEEKGLQQSQNCTLYNAIMTKYGEKLEDKSIKVLQAILISNISKFMPYNKEDMADVIKYSSGLFDEDIAKALKELEGDFGVIRFDEITKRYELLADANGRNEFNRKLVHYKIRIGTRNPIHFVDEQLSRDLLLDRVEETNFALNNNISSLEWKFGKRLVNIKEIDETYITANIQKVKNASTNDDTRGILNFIYVDKDSYNEINRVNKLIYNMGNDDHPIVYVLINDSDNKIKDTLIEYQALKQFTSAETSDFSKFINQNKKICLTKIIKTFFELASKRNILTNNEIEMINMRLSQYCNEIFKKQFTKPVNFLFDGFEKKLGPNVKRYFNTIGRGLITNSITNKKGLQGLDSDILNRVNSVLSINKDNSWKVMSTVGTLINPQTGVVREIYDEVYSKLELNKQVPISMLFSKYLEKPYTMNQYSLGLFIAYFIGNNSNELNIYNSITKVNKVDFSNKVFIDKNFNLEGLLKYKLEKIEGNQEEEIKRSIDSISNTLYVDDCGKGLIKLRALEKEELSPELFQTIELLKAKMQRGIDKNMQLKQQLAKYKEFYQKHLYKNFILRAIPQLRGLFAESFEGNIEGTEFEYSPTYTKEANTLKNDILASIDNNLESYINTKMKFSYEDCKQEEVLIKNIAIFLKDNSREELATLLVGAFNRRKQLLIEEQKFEKIFNEFDNFIKLNRILDNRNYSELESLKESIKNWNDRISDLTVSVDRKKKLFNDIVKLTEVINSRKEQLSAIRDEIYEECNNIVSKSQLNNIEIKINRYLKYLPEQEDEIKLKGILELIQNFNLEVKQLELNSTDRKKAQDLALTLKEEFKKSFLIEMVNNSINTIVSKLDELDIKWKENQISNIKNSLKSLTIEQCEEWKHKNRMLPLYLTDESIIEFKEVTRLINNKIKSSKVDGIISIFKELDDDEKYKCLKLLHGLV